MAKLQDKTVTVRRELLPEDAEFGRQYMKDQGAQNRQYVVTDDATGDTYFAYRNEITDHAWAPDPRQVDPPPLHPVYRNPHHPADQIPSEPDPTWKDPDRRDLKEPEVETPEQTKARHLANPNRNPNQPVDPIDVQKIKDAKLRESRVDALAAGRNPNDPDQMAGAGVYSAKSEKPGKQSKAGKQAADADKEAAFAKEHAADLEKARQDEAKRQLEAREAAKAEWGQGEAKKK